ncbi:MAG: FHA domain-containing protein [Hyphomicrobiaceae bacterium]
MKFMRAGLDRHPTVMLAGLTALAVPMVALARAVARAASDWRRRGERGLVPPGSGLVAHRLAWIETPDMRGSPVAIGELMRIGDSEDCDLAIPEASPGGTRALIQRTPENEFILFDVSAGEAYLAVNGAPSAKCRLNDGDRIEIGSACLMFRTGETAPLRTQSA